MTGVVKDEQGLTLSGVTVFLKYTTTGIITKMDGTYQLQMPEDGGVLVFSFIGMQIQGSYIWRSKGCQLCFWLILQLNLMK